MKKRKEDARKLEEKSYSLWAGSREVASPAEETVVVETQAERSMLTPSAGSTRKTWRRTRPEETSGGAKEESMISSIRSADSHRRHSTPKRRVVHEEVQEAASRRLAYDSEAQEEKKDPDAAKIPRRRFKSRFKFGERQRPTTAEAMVGTETEVREIETQTEVSLPRKTEVIWNCHISGTHAVLDIPERDPTVDELLVEDQCDDGESVTTDPRPMETVNEGVNTECQYYTMDQEESGIGSPDKTDHSMFDFDELDAMQPEGEEDRDAADLSMEQTMTRADEFDEFMHRATDEEVFAKGDEMRERYRLMELERVTEGRKKVQSGISDQKAMEIAKESRHKRLREDRAQDVRIIIRCGTMSGHTVQEAIDEYNAEKRARSPGTEATTETMESDTAEAAPMEIASSTQDRPACALGKSEVRKPRMAQKIGGRRYRPTRGMTVDSAAADNVMPRRMVRKKMKIRPSAASRAGVHYVAASDHRIANEGEVDYKFQTKQGSKHSWTSQVANANKVLAAVSALVDSNHRVVFDQDMNTGTDLSFITNKATNESIRMRRENNV